MNEMAIEVCKTQKSWGGCLQGCSLSFPDMSVPASPGRCSRQIDSWYMELTFLGLDKELVPQKSLEKLTDMLSVLCGRFRENQNIIKI